MALALGVKVGSRLSVGGRPLEIRYVRGLSVMAVVEGGEHLLSDQERAQPWSDWPEVWLSTARSRNNDGLTRVVFEAPRDIEIRRLG